MPGSGRTARGKLTWAGRAWARGELGSEARDGEAEDDARFFGLDLGAALDPEPGEGVWPENVAAVEAFLEVGGQWRTATRGDGGVLWIALDYTAARAGLELAGVAITPELWADLRIVAAGARAVLNGD